MPGFGKAQRLLGYKAKVSFEEGIKRTVQWYNDVYRSKEAKCHDLINAEKPCVVHMNA